MLASKVGEANGKENKNITSALKIAKQNNIRFRILACISLCDKIFSQVRNVAFNIKNEKNKSSDFFGKTEFLTNTKYKNTENLENFYNKIKFEHLIDINEKNFEDIFIKINVLRNWLVHHILDNNKNNNQDDNQKINDQNYQKFEDERNKFPRANFNFNNDLIDENILKNLLENLDGGLFKILPHDLCNEIYHQFWTFEKLLKGNPKEDKFKDYQFKKNLDKIKKEKELQSKRFLAPPPFFLRRERTKRI